LHDHLRSPADVVGAARSLAVVLALGMTAAPAGACTGGDGDGIPRSGQPGDASSDGEPQRGGTLRVGIERPDTYDPSLVSPASQSELLAADLLFDGLTAMVAGAVEASPSLASAWAPSPDLITWRFDLSPDRVFANGRAVTAADVKYSLERVAQRGNASLAAVRLEIVAGYAELSSGASSELTGVRVVGDHTVEIQTTMPFAELPELLSSPAYGVVPREAIEAPDASFATRPVGSGPFSWAGPGEGGEGEEAGAAEVVRLVRAADDSALLEGVDLFVYDDLAASYDAFVDGRVDFSLVPGGRVAHASERFGTDAFTPFQAELFYGFNLANPKFADVRFRQAIVQAVDRAGLVRAVYPGVAEPLVGVVPAGVPGHADDPCGVPCSFDPAGASALVGALYPAGAVPEVQIDYYEGATEEAAAGFIESSLEAVGIPAARRPKPFDAYQQFAVSGQQELFRLGWLGVYASPGAFVTPLFTSGGPDNVTGFADAGVDALLAAARSAVSAEDRLTRYAEAERAVMATVPILPLAQFRTRAVVAERVRDLAISVGGTFAAELVWLGDD
ncbi:MAG: peptide ABC transporter substrate-binding protein, partial [Acidimicrobiales bacterium]